MSDFLRAFPDNQKVLERDDRWKKLFEKAENCGDCEEDGYDIIDLIACAEVEDEENEEIFANEEEAVESSDESDSSKENNRNLVVSNGKANTIKDVEKAYDPEYLQGLKRAFKQRCSELDQLNLHFWKRSKTQEGFNESNIKTPNFEASTRSFFRSSEQECSSGKKSKQLSPKPFKMPHPVNFNRDHIQFQNLPQNMDSTNNIDTRFPFQLNEVMNGSQKINIRIREMHYDLSVDGRDVTEFFIPNCNSTYKNAIPALGNLTINNTIPNIQNLQQAFQPAIKYDVDQIRSEPTQKVKEKPKLDLSNTESLNDSVVDTFEEIKICDSSHEGYNSKGKNKRANKKKAQKKKPKKKHQRTKQKDVKCENNVREIVPVKTIVSISDKLELSYSDVVKLSPKNSLKQTKSSKPANDPKKQVGVQQKKKNSAEELKSYRRIIDPDTSTEDLVEEQVPPKCNKKVSKLNDPKIVDIPVINKSEVNKNEKPENPKQLERQTSKDVIKVESSSKTREKENNHKEGKKSKVTDKLETSNKLEVPKKPQKSHKSKEHKKLEEVAKIEIPLKSQGGPEKQLWKQKSKDNENEKKKQHERSCKTNDKSTKDSKSGTKNEPDLQYDENGNPFRKIGGFIVRYEENNSDSDSSEDDTEFFRRIHAEIREKKAQSKK